jgi:hypothetical protein
MRTMDVAKGPFIRLGLLFLVLTCFWLLPTVPSQSKEVQTKAGIPVSITQLISKNGPPPLEVLTMPVEVTGDSSFVLSCTLRNNSAKNINGANLSYSISFENNDGSIAKDVHSLTVESLIHPDFLETYKPIVPGGQTTVSSPRFAFGNTTPRSIEISVDYVEFEDGDTLGPNLQGSQIIAEMRKGAAIYKEWLRQQYLLKGRSVTQLLSTIQPDNAAMPDDLVGNGSKEQGAKAYRTLLRRLVDRKGQAEIKKYFPQ